MNSLIVRRSIPGFLALCFSLSSTLLDDAWGGQKAASAKAARINPAVVGAGVAIGKYFGDTSEKIGTLTDALTTLKEAGLNKPAVKAVLAAQLETGNELLHSHWVHAKSDARAVGHEVEGPGSRRHKGLPSHFGEPMGERAYALRRLGGLWNYPADPADDEDLQLDSRYARESVKRRIRAIAKELGVPVDKELP